MSFSAQDAKRLLPPVIAMGLVILLSNIAVGYPIQHTLGGIDLAELLTYGALTYPICFLVTDTTNRLYGAAGARKVVYVGFALGVVLSLVFADMRIALASGSAFLIAQLLDVLIFDKLRRGVWWQAPAISSFFGSAVDTGIFFSLAFAGTGLPWMSWAAGDFVAKLAMIAALLYPFKLLVALFPADLREARETA
ncbi:queuosine precursor transporter [Hwanghaeella sp.]|uniref:queuosine precursor transporter n=1 Tax=Hwanghaeella sp. TaxID=2605943 RepID=UPI003CCC2907